MTERTLRVVVTSDNTLADVIGHVREAAKSGQVVDLVVPIDSPLLLTAAEFRALKEALDADRVPAVLRTADPLRLQLAERLGLAAKPIPRAKPAPVAAARPVPVPAPPPVPENGNWPDLDEAPPEPAVRVDPASLWPVSEEQPGEDEETTEEEAAGTAAPANPPRRWLPVAMLLVLLVAGTAGAVRLLLPHAVVTIIPKTEPVAATLAFDVTGNGQSQDSGAAFAVPMQDRQIEVVWTGNVPATGVRVEPDGTAAGPIELRNAANSGVTVAAGTRVSTEEGVEFAFVEDVSVPAADSATGQPGAATSQVRATKPGSGGNVGQGEIGGQLPNGIYYSNRMEPTAGGTDKEFQVVAEADLEQLKRQAQEAAPTLAADLLAKEDSGQVIVPSTIEIAAQNDAFDHQAGEDAAAVGTTSTLTLNVKTYDGDAAAKAYEAALLASLKDDVPAGFAIDPERVTFANPVEQGNQNGAIRFAVEAKADAVAVLDDAERAALAAALAGASADEVSAILGKTPEIADYRVAYSPSWLVRSMPGNANQITFETEK
ncbi:MAG: baseplate J/gp47 family protein [Thermomicrobiales bacterium]